MALLTSAIRQRRILTANAGSTSVKLRIVGAGDRLEAERELPISADSTLREVDTFLDEAGPVDAVAHRVVHGGDLFEGATLVDPSVRRRLDDLADLAPLHNPPALAVLDLLRHHLPDVPAVVCFDTTFHRTMPPEATTYALPAEWVTRWGIRRYGFHGLSCAWATRRAGHLLATSPGDLRLVICHLGGGASVTAVDRGRSVDTTMGFTPLEGLVMATRGGDVDAGALVWMLDHGLALHALEEGLEHQSGLLGLSSGQSADMRELLAARTAGDGPAVLAIDVYVHRLQAKIAAMTASAGGLDALVFTGGIGEGSQVIRALACERLGWLGVAVDPEIAVPAGTDSDVSTTDSPVRTLVIHAREDLQMAAECRAVL
jgi:acetate kinase